MKEGKGKQQLSYYDWTCISNSIQLLTVLVGKVTGNNSVGNQSVYRNMLIKNIKQSCDPIRQNVNTTAMVANV